MSELLAAHQSQGPSVSCARSRQRFEPIPRVVDVGHFL